jgi:hypothetical protein
MDRTAGSVLDRVRASTLGQNSAGRYSGAEAVAGQTPAGATLARLRSSYRERLSGLQRGHFLETEQALERLRTFRDYSTIRQTLISLGVDPQNAKVEFVTAKDRAGYRLHGTVGTSVRAGRVMVLTDEQGRLKQTLTSKAQP